MSCDEAFDYTNLRNVTVPDLLERYGTDCTVNGATTFDAKCVISKHTIGREVEIEKERYLQTNYMKLLVQDVAAIAVGNTIDINSETRDVTKVDQIHPPASPTVLWIVESTQDANYLTDSVIIYDLEQKPTSSGGMQELETNAVTVDAFVDYAKTLFADKAQILDGVTHGIVMEKRDLTTSNLIRYNDLKMRIIDVEDLIQGINLMRVQVRSEKDVT